MKNKTIQWITRTAILLALALAFQSMRGFIPKVIIPVLGELDQYIIGALVNLCLIVAAVIVGIEGGLAVAILTPVIAFAQGEIKFPVMVPFVCLGNAVLVIMVGLFYRRFRGSRPYTGLIVGLISGALLKFLTLYITMVHIALPVIVPNLPEAMAKVVPATITLKFSWPQLVTAGLGGIISLSLLPVLNKVLKVDNKL